MKSQNNSSFLAILIVIILSYLSIRSLFNSGFFPMHDDTQVARVHEMKNAISDGMFPVRWTTSLGYGYGYPIFNFYAPMSYYTGGVIDLVINDSLLATKIMIALGVLLAGIFMCLLAKEFWGEVGGIVSGILYVYAPYHALNVYVRGAVAETYGYAFIPLAFYGFYKAWKVQNWKFVALGAIGFAGIILSHNLTAMMTSPFLVLMILVLSSINFQRNQLYAIRYMLYAFVLGLLLSAFYWLPSLGEMGYTNVVSQIGGGADYKDHFVCIPQLWDSIWSFGGSVPGCVDGLSFRIGKIHLLLTITTLIGLFLIKKHPNQKLSAFFSLTILIVSTFLLTSYSEFIWNLLSPMEYFQYPWRFLVLVSAASSFISGGLVFVLSHQDILKLDKKICIALSCLLIALIIFFYAKLFVPQNTIQVTDIQLINKENINWKVSKISDEYLPKDFKKPRSAADIPQNKITAEGAKVQIMTDKVHLLRASVVLSEQSTVHINTAYFPAWKAYINGKDTQIKKSNTGMDIRLPKGESELTLKFVETPIERIANFLSLTGISILFLAIIRSRRTRVLK